MIPEPVIERLPGFVWSVAGALLVICAAAFTIRFVVHQLVAAHEQLVGIMLAGVVLRTRAAVGEAGEHP